MNKTKSIKNSCHRKSWWLFFLFFMLMFFGLLNSSQAHQTPTTIVLLDVSPNRVAMELQLPLSELEFAFGHDVTKNIETLVERLGPQLKEYLKAHIHAFVTRENPWQVDINDMEISDAQQTASGPAFREITVHVILTPPAGVSTRKFLLDYDVIMHQVVNHTALVSIRNDWETGTNEGQPVEAGVIQVNTEKNVIYPLEINLEKGSNWKGFKNMLSLGMQHIKEGTDHLLFLIVLLLPAMLLTNGKKWGRFGGTKYSIGRLLKIVTAFTIGHSITLLIGALGWVHLPTQPVEILIAVSILVSAIHAVKPIFPGKEIYVASGFGLIHGLAFATILSNLHLTAWPMALSILGFNLGIELMQLFIIAIIVPWLIILSTTSLYKWIRPTVAILAAIAAMAWIAERSSGSSNIITVAVQKISDYATWLIVALAVIALAAKLLLNKKDTDFEKEALK